MKRYLLLVMSLLLMGCGKSYYLAEDQDCKQVDPIELASQIKACMTEFSTIHNDDLFATCEKMVKEAKCEKYFSYYTVTLGFGSDEKSPHIPCSLATDSEAIEICPKPKH